MRVRWTSRAFRDLEGIREYVAADNPKAAADLISDVYQKCKLLERFPLMGRTSAEPGIRFLLVRSFLIVAYRIVAEEVQILQVWHGARRRPPE